MLDRFREFLAKVQCEEDADFQELAADLEARVDQFGERVSNYLAAVDLRARIGLACVGTGLATTLISATVSEVGAVGSGYFLRLGILLLGVGLHQLLRK